MPLVDVIGDLLVKEVLKAQLIPQEAINLFEVIVVPNLICGEKIVEGLSFQVQIAIVIVLIGTTERDNFVLAFEIMRDWNSVRGCYWVACEEVLRHAVINGCEEVLRHAAMTSFPSKMAVCRDIEMIIDGILPKDLSYRIENTTLKERVVQLRKNFESLIVSFQQTDCPEKLLGDFAIYTPLEKFVPWFLDWSSQLLLSAVSKNRLSKKRQRQDNSLNPLLCDAALEDNPQLDKAPPRSTQIVKVRNKAKTHDDMASVNSTQSSEGGEEYEYIPPDVDSDFLVDFEGSDKRNLEECFRSQIDLPAGTEDGKLLTTGFDDKGYPVVHRSVAVSGAAETQQKVPSGLQQLAAELGLQVWRSLAPLDFSSPSIKSIGQE